MAQMPREKWCNMQGLLAGERGRELSCELAGRRIDPKSGLWWRRERRKVYPEEAEKRSDAYRDGDDLFVDEWCVGDASDGARESFPAVTEAALDAIISRRCAFALIFLLRGRWHCVSSCGCISDESLLQVKATLVMRATRHLEGHRA